MRSGSSTRPSSGTVLNGQRIDKNAPLGDGDILEFGPYRVEIGFVALQPVAGTQQPVVRRGRADDGRRGDADGAADAAAPGDPDRRERSMRSG
ncbi:MAG: FHA domain-containing protein [Nannocystaceae bacterium]